MCGLVGIYSSKLTYEDKKVFKTLLFIDQIRGEHSTGIATLNKHQEITTYKRALAASDFLQLSRTSDTISDAESLIIGHNRYATQGAKNDSNAHPFTHGNVTLVHNGTLYGKHHLSKETFPTDSETVCYEMSHRNYIEVLEELDGAYALVWWDERDSTLNFARNKERPLYLGTINGCLVWASNREMLELAATNAKKTLQNVEELPVGRLFSYTKWNERMEENFTPKKPQPATSRTHTRWTQQRAGVTVIGRTSSSTSNTTNTDSTSKSLPALKKSGRIGSKVIAEIYSVSDGGYISAYTATNDLVHVTVSKDKIPDFRRAAENNNLRLRGMVSSIVNDQGFESLHLSAKDVELISFDETRIHCNCHLCGFGIYNQDREHHMGMVFHTECLDKFCPTEQREVLS